MNASVAAAYLPHRVNLSSEALIMNCNYTAITPEVVIRSIIDALLGHYGITQLPPQVTGAEASSSGNVSTVNSPHDGAV